jgi:hypothetical protein
MILMKKSVDVTTVVGRDKLRLSQRIYFLAVLNIVNINGIFMIKSFNLSNLSISRNLTGNVISSQLNTLGLIFIKSDMRAAFSHASAVAQGNVVRAMSASYGKSLYSTLRRSQTP